jgi:hypothetical protein
MKIKMTLIAFFATALMFTSCVKNEVSPGIEDVRSAYAELLSAKAQTEVIAANAQANWDNAQATFLEAQAAVELAKAASTAATSADEAAAAAQELARLQAVLAQQLQDWADQNALDAIAVQTALDGYALAVQGAQNLAATTYFYNYVGALDALAIVQNNIMAKNIAIVALGLDIENGTSVALDAANAALAFWTAELETAKTLNDVAAVADRLAELEATKLANDKTILELAVDIAEIAWDDAVERADLDAAETAVTAAGGVLAVAEADLADPYAAYELALEDGLNPGYWTDALEDVADAEAALACFIADTTTSSDAYYGALAIITAGTTVLDGLKQDALDEIDVLGDSLTGLVADSVNAAAALELTQDAIVDLQADINDWGDEVIAQDALVVLYADTLASLGDAGYPANTHANVIIYTDLEDAAQLASDVAAANIVLAGPEMDALLAQDILDAAALTLAEAAYDDPAAGYDAVVAAIGVLQDSIDDHPGGLYDLIAAQ